MRHFFCIIVIFFVISCKKEKQQDAPTTSTNATTNNNGSTPSNATSWYGLLSCKKSGGIVNGATFGPSYEYNAFFSNSPVVMVTPTYSVTVDSVEVNQQPLYLLSNYYYANGGGNKPDTTKWQVYGNNGIPSFTFNNSNPMPDFNDNGSLPDSASHSSSFILPLSAFTNYDIATLYVTDNTHTLAQPITIGSNNISISASSMSGLDTTTYGSFMLVFRKNNVQKIGSKDFNFINEYWFTKEIRIY